MSSFRTGGARERRFGEQCESRGQRQARPTGASRAFPSYGNMAGSHCPPRTAGPLQLIKLTAGGSVRVLFPSLLHTLQPPQRLQDCSPNRPLPVLYICAPALGQPAKLINSLLEIGQIPSNCTQIGPEAR